MATDDVPMLGALPTLFHGIWAVALLVIWGVLGSPHSCEGERAYTVVLAGLFTTFLLFFVLGCWAIYEGLKGGKCALNGLHAPRGCCVGCFHARASCTMPNFTCQPVYIHTAGSIFETEKRARVPYLLYALAVVALGEIAFTGMYAAYPHVLHKYH